jgi:hypothetical protein
MISESDPTLKAKIRGDKVTAAAAAFMKACPEYLSTDANYEAVMRRMARTHLGQPFTTSDQAEDALAEAGFFTKENIVAAYKSLLALGQLEVKPGQVKVLSEAEKREVAVAIATDGEEIAVIQHLNFQLGTLPDVDSPRELLTRYATEASAAAFFVFAHTCSDFEDTPAWRAFLKSKLANRYGVLTVSMLREFWNGFRFRNEGTFPVETTTADPTASGPDYSEMSSEQIAKIFEDTQRAARIERARQGR